MKPRLEQRHSGGSGGGGSGGGGGGGGGNGSTASGSSSGFSVAAHLDVLQAEQRRNQVAVTKAANQQGMIESRSEQRLKHRTQRCVQSLGLLASIAGIAGKSYTNVPVNPNSKNCLPYIGFKT